MTVQKILIPVNLGEMDRKALSFVVDTFAHRKDVQIALLHLYTPIPQIETPSDTVMGRLTSSMQYLSGLLREKEDTLKENRSYLLDRGFEDAQVDYIFRARARQVADEIIDIARKSDFDTIVLSCKSSRITRLFLQSVHQKVIASLSDATVCIVT